MKNQSEAKVVPAPRKQPLILTTPSGRSERACLWQIQQMQIYRILTRFSSRELPSLNRVLPWRTTQLSKIKSCDLDNLTFFATLAETASNYRNASLT